MFDATSEFPPSRKRASDALAPAAKRPGASSEEEIEDEDGVTLLTTTLAEPK